jgi:hypothetical protein
MKKLGAAANAPDRRARAGRTEKISVSLERSDVLALRRRAKKLYGGNLSAAVAEGARRILEEEGREALVTWLGGAADATAEERAAVVAEWASAPTEDRAARKPGQPPMDAKARRRRAR